MLVAKPLSTAILRQKNSPKMDTPAPRLSPMEHAAFIFDLIYPRFSAHPFGSKAEADAFAGGIRESKAMAIDDRGRSWCVRVGPYAFAHNVRPRPSCPA